jgi:hypothetical protein
MKRIFICVTALQFAIAEPAKNWLDTHTVEGSGS